MNTDAPTNAPQVQARLQEGLSRAQAFLAAGDHEMARTLCEDLLRQWPQQEQLRQLLSEIEFAEHLAAVAEYFPGPDYQHWLAWFHDTLKPRGYVEIGVESGASLRYAREGTRAIGIDPALAVRHSLRAWTRLFQLTSDDFFFTYDFPEILAGEPLDLAFIDGLHTFDQALKDFINIERNAHPNTVVLFHDIYPVTPSTAARNRVTTFWVGDTWKVLPLIRSARPDLKIFTIPTQPSGLGVITGLDPQSSVLRRNFERLVETWMPIRVEDHMDRMREHTGLLDSNSREAVCAALGWPL